MSKRAWASRVVMGIFDWLLKHGEDEQELEDAIRVAQRPRSEPEADVVIVPFGQLSSNGSAEVGSGRPSATELLSSPRFRGALL